MDDKMFELMEKMYIEFSSFKIDVTNEFKGIRQDLTDVKEDVKGLKEDVKGLKEDVKGLKEDVKGLKGDVKGLQGDVKGLKEDVKGLDVKVNKNTMLLEKLTSKVEIIAEVQKSHMDQNEKAHKDLITKFNERTEVVELAVKDTSKDVKEIKNGLINVEIITSSNWNEIAKLKAIK